MKSTPKSNLDEMLSDGFIHDDPLMFCNRLMHTELQVVCKPGPDPLSPILIRQTDQNLLYAAFASEEALIASTKPDGSRMVTTPVLGFDVCRMAAENGAGIILNVTLPTQMVLPADVVERSLSNFPCNMNQEGEIRPLNIDEIER